MAQHGMTKIKICGITNLPDATMVCENGADAIGFVFVPSHRYIEPEAVSVIRKHLPPFVTTVGIFMDTPLDEIQRIIEITGIDAVQLHGNESPDYCHRIPRRIIKRIPVKNRDTSACIRTQIKRFEHTTILLDPGAGNGKIFDWTIARCLEQPVIIAGGLTSDNIGNVIRLLKPYGVDVSSGVETSPGIKNEKKVAAFIKEVRTCS